MRMCAPKAHPVFFCTEHTDIGFFQESEAIAKRCLATDTSPLKTDPSRDLMDAVMEKSQQINKIEQAIGRLQKKFEDLQALVSLQGLVLDEAESEVAKAAIQVKKGLQNMKTANKFSRKKRMQMVCCLVVICVVCVWLAAK